MNNSNIHARLIAHTHTHTPSNHTRCRRRRRHEKHEDDCCRFFLLRILSPAHNLTDIRAQVTHLMHAFPQSQQQRNNFTDRNTVFSCNSYFFFPVCFWCELKWVWTCWTLSNEHAIHPSVESRERNERRTTKKDEKRYSNLLSMTDESSVIIKTQQSHGEKCIRCVSTALQSSTVNAHINDKPIKVHDNSVWKSVW